MKKLSMIFAGAALALGVQAVMAGPVADRVSGSPKANFSTDELTIPCVKVESLSADTEGKFYDIVLKRRGKSMNYELQAADAEDPVQCQRIADFADFEEDEGEPSLLAQCSTTTTRSQVDVQSKDLDDGDYYVVVSSGTANVESEAQEAEDGEVEFDFDSDSTAVAAGAEAIEATFIKESKVTVKLYDDADDDAALLTTTATCTAS